MPYLCRYDSPLGPMLLAADEAGVTGAWFEGQKYFAARLGPGSAEGDSPALAGARRWLDLYFAGREPDFMPPLHLTGTAFQLAVWELLRAIPYGQTTTYGTLARRLAARQGLDRMSAQAVGGAVGRNPLCVIVPCHRVMGASGNLTGFGGGIATKKKLLELEGVDISGFYTPKTGTAL